MNKFDKKIVGLRIRRARESMKLSRDSFSEECGISMQFLAEIENGVKGPSAETLYKICGAFGLSADYILMGRIYDVKGSSPVTDLLNTFNSKELEAAEQILLQLGSLKRE